jgi:hypothetical protein
MVLSSLILVGFGCATQLARRPGEVVVELQA